MTSDRHGGDLSADQPTRSIGVRHSSEKKAKSHSLHFSSPNLHLQHSDFTPYSMGKYCPAQSVPCHATREPPHDTAHDALASVASRRRARSRPPTRPGLRVHRSFLPSSEHLPVPVQEVVDFQAATSVSEMYGRSQMVRLNSPLRTHGSSCRCQEVIPKTACSLMVLRR
jgi:hypothetical protein